MLYSMHSGKNDFAIILKHWEFEPKNLHSFAGHHETLNNSTDCDGRTHAVPNLVDLLADITSVGATRRISEIYIGDFSSFRISFLPNCLALVTTDFS